MGVGGTGPFRRPRSWAARIAAAVVVVVEACRHLLAKLFVFDSNAFAVLVAVESAHW